MIYAFYSGGPRGRPTWELKLNPYDAHAPRVRLRLRGQPRRRRKLPATTARNTTRAQIFLTTRRRRRRTRTRRKKTGDEKGEKGERGRERASFAFSSGSGDLPVVCVSWLYPPLFSLLLSRPS